MKTSLSSIPLLPITIGIILGIILEGYLSLIFLFAIFILSIFLWVIKKKTISIILFSITLGWINCAINKPQNIPTEYLNNEFTFTATVLKTTENDNIRNVIADINSIIISNSTIDLNEIKCSLAIPSLNPEIEQGDIITFITKITPIADKRDLPDEFDYVGYLKQQGIYISAFVEPENILVSGVDNSLIWRIKRIKNYLTTTIASLPLSENCIEFLNTTITGDTTMLSEEHRIKYSTSGLAHILALSGLHVGIISFLIAIALFPFDLVRLRSLRYLLSIILLWFYAIMTGLSPSVTRAVIMATIFLIAIILQRNNNPFNSLCFAAIIILLFDPSSIHDIGFQLSFIAVISILLFARKLNPINERKRILYNIVSSATVSLSAMIGTGIIASFYFHNFPVYFLIANIIASYLLPVIIIGGIIALITTHIGFDPTWICIVTDYAYNIIDNLTSFITTLPGASIDKIYFKAWLLIPYFSIVASFYFSLKYKRAMWHVITIALIIFTITISIISKPQYPKSEYFIPRNTYYTNIIMRDSSSLYLITTAHGGDSIDAINKCGEKYRDYMGWRNVDSLIVVPKNYSDENILRKDPLIVIGSDIVAIIDNNNDVKSFDPKPNYALICKGFNGDIIDVYKTISPDTILLSKDLHKKRINRYIDSCTIHNIPFISLRDKSFHQVIEN